MPNLVDPDLLLHLPCNAVDKQRLIDASKNASHIQLPQGVELQPDAEWGRAVAFMAESRLEALRTSLPESPDFAITLMAWIRADAATLAAESAVVFESPASSDLLPEALPVVAVRLVYGRLEVTIGQRVVGVTTEGFDATSWQHLAVVWDGITKAVACYLNGVMIPLDSSSLRQDRTVGVLNFPSAQPILFIGSKADGTGIFTGHMAGIRVFKRALNPDEVAQVEHDERHEPDMPFDHHHPLSFRLSDDLGHSRIAILDNTSFGRHLFLIIGNSSPFPIEFRGPEAVRSARNPAHENYIERPVIGTRLASRDDHHLEIVFRPGTIDPKDAQRITALDSDWHVRAQSNEDGTLSLLMLRPEGMILPAGGLLTIVLANVKAAIAGGSRSTQVELRFQHLRYATPNRLVFRGHRLAHLDVENQRGRPDAPLVAGFIGSNTVLNDGETRNTLVLYVGNPSLKNLSLRAGELEVRPRLSIRFDCGQLDESDEPWTLAHADEVMEIEIAPQGKEGQGWIVHRTEQSETPEWILQPPDDNFQLQSNTWINFVLYPIVTRSPSGFANLRLSYRNIDGYRDGELVIPIEKAARLYRQQPVPSASSPLTEQPRTVHAFSDSVVIGRRYAHDRTDDLPTPPTYPDPDSLVVQEKIGIGTGATPIKGQLQVTGDIYAKGHLWLHAYEGDGKDGTAYVQARDQSGTSSLSMQFRTHKQGSIVEALRLSPEGRLYSPDSGRISIPVGTIVMWSNFRGQEIPDGWKLCDGQDGRPDLRDRFIVGSGRAYGIGNTGGADQVALNVWQIPSHQHSGNTNVAGNHSHNIPSSDGGWAWNHGRRGDPRDSNNGVSTSAGGDHTHSFTTDLTGGNQSHENRPPYYALAFIIKVE